MSPKEESTKWTTMASTNIEPIENEGTTLWNHTKTFALVGVSLNDVLATLVVD